MPNKNKLIAFCIVAGVLLFLVSLPYIKLFQTTNYLTGEYMEEVVINSAEKGINYYFEEMRYYLKFGSENVIVICHFTANGRNYYLLADGKRTSMIDKPRNSKKIAEYPFFQYEDGTVIDIEFQDMRMEEFWNSCKVYSRGADKLNDAYEKIWDKLIDNYKSVQNFIHEMKEKQEDKLRVIREFNR